VFWAWAHVEGLRRGTDVVFLLSVLGNFGVEFKDWLGLGV
jgi:hypothetical protein